MLKIYKQEQKNDAMLNFCLRVNELWQIYATARLCYGGCNDASLSYEKALIGKCGRMLKTIMLFLAVTVGNNLTGLLLRI